MPIPNFQEAMLPILDHKSDGAVHAWSDLRDVCARAFEATAEELAERIPSGGSRFDSRVQWALTHLVQAGLLTRPQRGHVQITPRGKDVLAQGPERIDVPMLNRFEDYQNFRSRSRTNVGDEPSSSHRPAEDESTPLESIDRAVRESNEALAAEVLQRVLDQSPVFLEYLVLKLLSAMGYGGRAGAAEHWGPLR